MAEPDMHQRVITALGRLARGTFARCDLCGAQIDDRRLRIAPDADRCTRHLLDAPMPQRDRPSTGGELPDTATRPTSAGTPHR